MTAGYRVVQWNRHKKVYDAVLAAAIVGYVAVFVLGGIVLFPAPHDIAPPVLLMRAFGTLAILLLHVILAIGPLARLSPRFSPLLYNRRHLGVAFFLVALLHALAAVGFYGGFGQANPLVAVLGGSGRGVPWEALGFLALLVFFLMAATSHDFWLANLSPQWWKQLHLLVIVAYLLVVAHVAFGALQSERAPIFPVLLGGGAVVLTLLHVTAGLRQWRIDGRDPEVARGDADWLDAGPLDALDVGHGTAVNLPDGTRAAIFRLDAGTSVCAVADACAHQGGPLSEGRVVDGCITCPWHGYQYRPEDGASPPPYTERLATYEVRVRGGRLEIDPTPRTEGGMDLPGTDEEHGDG